MRIDELIPPNSPKRNTAPQPGAAKELKPGSIGRVNNITYKYYDGKGWLDQNGLPARGIANRVLMKQYGRDDSGQPLAPSIGQKISAKLGGPFGQGTDPKANLFTKAMGKIGSALGRGAAALIRPKQEPVPADADGDGQPDAQAPATAQPNQSGAQGALSGNAAVQNMNSYIKSVAAELNKPGVNKVALTKELVNYMADRKGTPEWNNASTSLKAILKRAGLDPKFANTALQRVQAGQTMESMQIVFINSLLEEINLTFADLGLTETVIETEGVKRYMVEDSNLANLRKLAGI